jgi:hypothetical protein
MIRPVPSLPALVLIVLYFLALYRLIRLSPYLVLDWTDYWEPWPPLPLSPARDCLPSEYPCSSHLSQDSVLYCANRTSVPSSTRAFGGSSLSPISAPVGYNLLTVGLGRTGVHQRTFTGASLGGEKVVPFFVASGRLATRLLPNDDNRSKVLPRGL